MDTKRHTDLTYRQAKPKETAYRIVDGRGLYMQVNPSTSRFPSGTKSWCYRFELNVGGKRRSRILTIGQYPAISLEKARQKAEEARLLLAEGIDPAAKKQADKLAKREQDKNSFELIAQDFLKKRYAGNDTGELNRQRLDNHVFPFIGKQPIATLTAQDFIRILKRIEDRNIIETARRVRSVCSMVMDYAYHAGLVESNPVHGLRGLIKAQKKRHFAAITDPAKVGGLLRAIDGYVGGNVVKCALKLAPLMFVRPGELQRAKWVDFDLDKAEWRYTVTKTNTEHIVPLSRQAVAILKEELQPLTGEKVFLFPSPRTDSRPISDATITAALRTMGFTRDEMTAHGFRAMARTILDEELGEPLDFIEHQLAHGVRDPLGTAYNRTKHLAERCRMMQRWADYLDLLKAGETPENAKATVTDRWWEP